MTGGGGAIGGGDDEAKPFQAFEVGGDRIEFFLGVFAGELGGNLGHGPLASAGAQQVANGGELGFGLSGPGLLLDGGNDGGFGGQNAVEGGLGGFSWRLPNTVSCKVGPLGFSFLLGSSVVSNGTQSSSSPTGTKNNP